MFMECSSQANYVAEAELHRLVGIAVTIVRTPSLPASSVAPIGHQTAGGRERQRCAGLGSPAWREASARGLRSVATAEDAHLPHVSVLRQAPEGFARRARPATRRPLFKFQQLISKSPNLRGSEVRIAVRMPLVAASAAQRSGRKLVDAVRGVGLHTNEHVGEVRVRVDAVHRGLSSGKFLRRLPFRPWLLPQGLSPLLARQSALRAPTSRLALRRRIFRR
jgi:hypothetical protein